MSKRRHTTALYEVIQSGNRGAAATRPSSEDRGAPAPPPAPVEANEPSPATTAAAGSPTVGGRILRIPVGYVFVAIGGMLVLLLIAYSVGYGRGKQVVAIEDSAGGTLDESDEPLPIFDPMRRTTPASNEQTRSPEGTANASPSRSNGGGDRTPAITDTARLYEDTRQRGLNYVIITRADRDEAERAARFLISRNVDVLLAPDKNTWLVISRRGFDSWYSNREAQQYFEQVKSLGREWKSKHGGERNFNDAYPKKYQG